MAFVTVTATVERVFFDGKGLALVEEYKTKDGEVKTNRFTAWFDEAPGLAVNSQGTFSGILSTKIEEFEGRDGETKRVVGVSLNKAKVKEGVGQGIGRAEIDYAKSVPAGWAEVPTPVEDAPF